jgi:hypothetical protein
MFPLKLAGGDSAVVDHSTLHPKVEYLSLAAAPCTGIENFNDVPVKIKKY